MPDLLTNAKNLYVGTLSTTEIFITPPAGKKWIVLEIRLCAQASVSIDLSLVVDTTVYPIYKSLGLAAGNTLVDPSFFIVPDGASLKASTSGNGVTLHLNGCEV